jgi:hypothetical protein
LVIIIVSTSPVESLFWKIDKGFLIELVIILLIIFFIVLHILGNNLAVEAIPSISVVIIPSVLGPVVVDVAGAFVENATVIDSL